MANLTGKGYFEKGKSGNPNGRPQRPVIERLREALQETEQEKGKSFIKHFVELAFTDNRIAITLANKIIPDLSKKELNTTDGDLNLEMFECKNSF